MSDDKKHGITQPSKSEPTQKPSKTEPTHADGKNKDQRNSPNVKR